MSNPKEPDLTREAKEAIRAYILKLVAIPALAASILSFVLGYVIQEGAAGRALSDALKDILPRITTASTAAEEASAAASRAKANSEKTLTDAEAVANRLKGLEEVQKALAQADKLVPEVTKLLEPQIKKMFVESVFGSAPAKIQTATSSRGDWRDITCPPGTYMNGISFAMQSGGDHGQVYAVTPICKPFLAATDTKQP